MDSSISQVEALIRDSLSRLVGDFSTPSRLLLAVSGGLDSMVLLDCLSRFLPIKDLAVGHYNHGLRGLESEGDETFVREQCRSRGIAFFVARGIPTKGASELHLREARRDFLQSICRDEKYDFIVTAHHADDQLETLLMRLLRGTGLDGLRAIQRRNNNVLRPMLDLSRTRLKLHANQEGIAFRTDRTNAESVYLRNRLRHHIIPKLAELAADYGDHESLLRRIVATTDEIAALSSELATGTHAIGQQMFVRTPYWTRFSLPSFLGHSEEIQLRLLRYLFAEWRRDQIPDRMSAQRVRVGLEKGTRRIEVEGGISVITSCNQVFVFRNGMAPAPRLIATQNQIHSPELGLTVIIDEPKLLQLVPRFFQPGDYQGNHKLKRLFLEKRIPRPERCLLPLLVHPESGETVWHFPQTHRAISLTQIDFPFSFLPARTPHETF